MADSLYPQGQESSGQPATIDSATIDTANNGGGQPVRDRALRIPGY